MKEINKAVKAEYKEPQFNKSDLTQNTNFSVDAKTYLIPKPQGATKAMAKINVKLEDVTVSIHSISVRETEKDGKITPFVSMPQTKDKEGKYRPVAHSINADLTKAINEAVLKSYKEQVFFRDKAIAKEAAQEKTQDKTKEKTQNTEIGM